MIILRDKPGQMCNRLWSFSFFIAYGLKHNINIYIPNLKEYESLFENLNQFRNIKFNLSENRRTEKLIRFLVLFIYLFNKLKIGILLRIFNICFPDNNHLDKSYLAKNRIYYINSWKHKKDYESIVEFKPEIISLFTPKKEFREKADKLFPKLNSMYDILIGVHIRRGDYLNFHNGSYYFDDSVYSRLMNMLASKPGTKKVGFFISTNEVINPEKFKDLNIHLLDNSLGIEDLYALSKCDYIMGPPSTFSMWASFYGSVPLKLIEDENETFSYDDFSVIRYQNTFENGGKYY
jgi:hypothetical protein